MITPEQSRAARGLLDWSQTDLAEQANLSESTIRDFEKGRRIPAPNNIAAIVDAFYRNGVSLIPDAETSENGGIGVRLTSPSNIGYLKRRLSETDQEVTIISAQIESMQSLANNNPKLGSDKLFIEHRINLEQELHMTKSRRKELLEKISRTEGDLG